MYSSTLSLTSALDGMGGQRHAPTALPAGHTRYPLYRRLGGAQGRPGRMWKISLPPGFDLRTVQPVASRYTEWAIIIALDHTQTHTHPLGRTPLDQGSARRRALYLTTHKIHSRQTSMPPVGLEPAIPACERQQTCALDRAANGIGMFNNYSVIKSKISVRM